MNKAYRGPKSINLVISKKEGIMLARAILQSVENGDVFDLAVHDYQKRKDGKVKMTVTQLKR